MAYIKFKPLTAELTYTKIIEFNDLEDEVKKIFNEDEKIYIVCQATRDLFILTDRRITIVDCRGIRGFRRSIYSVPFQSVSTYNIEIHNINTAFEILTTSGYEVKVRFQKPIPLDTMYSIYKYISNKVNNCD